MRRPSRRLADRPGPANRTFLTLADATRELGATRHEVFAWIAAGRLFAMAEGDSVEGDSDIVLAADVQRFRAAATLPAV